MPLPFPLPPCSTFTDLKLVIDNRTYLNTEGRWRDLFNKMKVSCSWAWRLLVGWLCHAYCAAALAASSRYACWFARLTCLLCPALLRLPCSGTR
jgi:uncharacterized membrane protein YhdT